MAQKWDPTHTLRSKLGSYASRRQPSLGNQQGQLFAVERRQFLDFCLFISLAQSVGIVVFE